MQPMDVTAPGRNLEAYLATISNVAILSVEEEKKLAEKFYYNQDLDAARQLVLSHLRFVAHIARGYSGYGLNQADLIQEGNLGLMKAVRRFDPRYGVRLVSFAVHWIKAEIHEYILRNWRIVKVTTTKAQRKLFFNLRQRKKGLNWLNDEEVTTIAEDLGVSEAEVRVMESRLASHDTPFDGASDDDDSAPLAPAGYLASPQPDPGTEVEQNEWAARNNDALYQALDVLDERSRDVIVQRWLAEEKTTLHKLAEKYGISAERVRQLEQSAMKKVRASITDQTS